MKKSTLPLRRDNFHVRASLRIRDSLRIVGAIAAKDIVDALKNKTTVTTIFTVVFLMLFYRFMPMLESGDVLPRAAVYDLGNSGLVTGLENSTDVYVRQLDSQDQMEAYVADENLVVMGLTIPAGFDETVEAGGPAVLEGYTVHWASEDDIVETKALFEQQLSQSAGR